MVGKEGDRERRCKREKESKKSTFISLTVLWNEGLLSSEGDVRSGKAL